MSSPISAIRTSAVLRPTRGIVSNRRMASAKGASLASI
jgi:hypothetical protein